MDIFENSKFLATDGVFTATWEGQWGGIEGLAQKSWTWIYETVASKVAKDTGYHYHLMVNGDDWRVILYIPEDTITMEELPERLRLIAENFEEEYQMFGFTLKLQESY